MKMTLDWPTGYKQEERENIRAGAGEGSPAARALPEPRTVEAVRCRTGGRWLHVTIKNRPPYLGAVG